MVSGKGPVAFDTGRAAQNMMLAAWNEGVVSSPNGIANPERLGGRAPDARIGRGAEVSADPQLATGFGGGCCVNRLDGGGA